MTFPRPLSDREREILDFLLADPDERLAPLRTQAETATVTGICECGCPTINLEVDRTLPPASLGSPAVETGTREVAGMDPLSYVGLILFLDEGFLNAMELWYISSPPPAEFPSPLALAQPSISG